MQPPSVPPTSPRPGPLTPRRCGAALLAAALFGGGCHHTHKTARVYDDSPPPVQVVTQPAPPAVVKPMPGQDAAVPVLPPPANDQVIIRQQPPEEPAFVAAYNGIGKPKLMVFVNRTVTGELVPVVPGAGPAPGADRPMFYLQHGQYDEAQAGSIDYALVENLLAEDLSAGGKVTMIAPLGARQRLTDDDIRDIQAGRAQMLGELATKLNADVLVQVTAHPSQQTEQGLGIRLVAEAVNTHGGQAIAFASADVAPPLTKDKLGESVRFVARKLMAEMSDSWTTMAAPPAAAVAPPPAMVPPRPAVVVPAPAVPPPVVPPAQTMIPTGATPAVTPMAVTPPATPMQPATTPTVATPPMMVAPPVPTTVMVTPAPAVPAIVVAPTTAPATRPTAANPLDLPPPP